MSLYEWVILFLVKEKDRGWFMDTRGGGNQVEKIENNLYCPTTSSSKREEQGRCWGIILTKDSEKPSVQLATLQGSGKS